MSSPRSLLTALALVALAAGFSGSLPAWDYCPQPPKKPRRIEPCPHAGHNHPVDVRSLEVWMHCAEETYLREGPPEDERKREGSAKDSSKCRCTQEQGPCDHHRHEPWREGWVVDEEPGWMTERPFRVPTPRDNPATSQQSHMHRLAHSAWHTHTLEDTTVIHHRHDHTHEYAHTGQDITEAQQETRVREEPGKGDWSIPPNPRLLECFRGRHPLIDLRDREPFD